MVLVLGQVLENRYRVDALLGQGGMGAVYRAWDTRLDQHVAIKENTVASPASVRQFEREAKVMARLRHPNLPRVSDHFVVPNGTQYLVMEYIDGEDLEQVLRRGGPLDERQAVAWIGQMCDALSYLHSQQPPIIHRDVKPANVKITPCGEVFLVDFGIVKVGDARAKTTMGALGVTPGFSPPEQYGSGGTDVRSDVYALGATLYALLTGKTPPDSVQRSIQEATLASPQSLRPDLSPAIASALEAALRTRPTDRPQTVAAFQALLRAAIVPSVADVPEPQATLLVEPPLEQAPPAGTPHVTSSYQVVSEEVGVKEEATIPPGKRPAATDDRKAEADKQVVISHSSGAEAPPLRRTKGGLVVATPENISWLFAQPQPPARIWWELAGMELRLVPAGEFPMGSPEGVGSHNEHPRHEVTVDAYYIGRFPVTQAQYSWFTRETDHRVPYEKPFLLVKFTKAYDWNQELRTPPAGKEDHPIVVVSWDDAVAYCDWAGLRLPTEAEWEKAASWDFASGRKRVYPWGDEWEAKVCTWRGTAGGTTPVGKYSPAGDSPNGCADMAGNASEWVADWYSKDAYLNSPTRNPTGPSDGGERVARGGAWHSSYQGYALHSSREMASRIVVQLHWVSVRGRTEVRSMAKVGINAFLWTARWDADPSPVLNRAKTLGFDAVQIPILDLASFDFRAMQKAVEELGFDCYVSAGLKDHMDVTSEDAEPRRLGVEHLKGCVRIAAQMGSPFLSGSFHSVFGKKPDGPVYKRHWERSAECLRQVAVEAQRYNLCLALEPINRYESFLINTAEQARRLIGLIDEPNMRIQLDTFHMNLEEDNPADSIRAAGADMVHFHVAESHRGRFGRGTMQWDEIFAALVDIDYRGALIIETFVPEVSEVAVAAGIWRKMAPSGDALAREGLAFVRALASKYAL